MLEELNEQLSAGIVKFSYAKKEGEERIAFGTTNRDLVPVQYSQPEIQTLYENAEHLRSLVTEVLEQPETDFQDDADMTAALALTDNALAPFRPKKKRETSSESKPSEYLNYYDFAAKGWRKFHPEKLVKIY